MSLIHTCELNAVNPFDYLTELQKTRREAGEEPDGVRCRGITARPWNRPVRNEDSA